MAMSEHINWKRGGEPKKFFTIKSGCMEAPEDRLTKHMVSIICDKTFEEKRLRFINNIQFVGETFTVCPCVLIMNQENFHW